jgi:hypothetical protein
MKLDKKNTLILRPVSGRKQLLLMEREPICEGDWQSRQLALKIEIDDKKPILLEKIERSLFFEEIKQIMWEVEER